ncbi:MAG: hypothetical protein FWD40_02465 [Treponema sp.]|nr:hypothetical protein [Treponema sp.]
MNKLILSPIIGDSMIMQRDVHFPIWSAENICVSFLGKTYESVKINEKHLVTIDPAKAGGPFTMEIKTPDSSLTVNDIYIGDVWLCSGQSNMEMQMQRLYDDFSEEWEKNEFPLIRQFKVPQEWDFSSPRENLNAGSWLCPSKDTLSEFAATPWFFAKNLYEKYRIPIGIINTAWGGTPVESWMSEEALSDYPSKIAEGKQYANQAKIDETAKKYGDAISEWETNVAHEDTGIAKQWQNLETDISEWDDITLPGNFCDSGIRDFCGAIWLAKEFDASQDFANREARIWLGTIVDADTVYINGTQIGSTGYRYPPRKYIPRGLVKQGKNRIVIRVTCNNGEGGITCDKPFRIFTDNESVELAGRWKYKIGFSTTVRPPDFFFQRQPMGNYNAMIAPVLKFPLKGVIWYQGESNESNPHEYASLFKLMITSWRKNNNNGKLPFLFVQLPIFGNFSENEENASWAIIREAQKNALSLPVTGMAAALELGEWNDIHPINKKDVGYRLFLAAEKVVFGVDNTSPGPVLQKLKTEGNKIYLYFDNCGSGLVSNDQKVYVSVTTDDGLKRLPAQIEDKNILSIDILSVKGIKKIMYAWANNPKDRSLFNSEGLPLLPFMIDINGE